MSEKKSLHCPNCGASVSPDCVRCPYCRSVLSVTSCPRCFASVFKGMTHCPDCGMSINRSIVAEEKKLFCPKCAVPLKHILVGDVYLCECDTCNGLWLDKDTFSSICEEKSNQEQILAYDRLMVTVANCETEQDGWRYLPCPECGEIMLRKNFLGCSGVIIDWCNSHGTWFEYKELQQIVQFIQSGGLLKAKNREIEKTKAAKFHQDVNNMPTIHDGNESKCLNPISRDNDLLHLFFKLLIRWLS